MAALTLACVWGATLLVFSATMILRQRFTWHIFTAVALPMMLEGLLDAQLYVLLRLTEFQSTFVRWVLLVPAAIVVDLLESAWDTQLRQWAGLLRPDYYNEGFLNGVVRALPVNIYHSGMLLALFAVQEAYFQLREHQRRLLAAQASERDAHLAALRLQLNPHFLFNSMNALSGLVVSGRNGEADAMIERLSAFLRATLGSDPVRRVPLAEEFDMLDAYLAIETVRFGERLTAELRLPPDLESMLIPPFLLQPLVENAVKYAVAPARRAICVRVSAEVADQMLLLRVEDDGDGGVAAMPGTGLGLVNVRERLRLEYGEHAHFKTEPNARGFVATIRLPLAATPALSPARGAS